MGQQEGQQQQQERKAIGPGEKQRGSKTMKMSLPDMLAQQLARLFRQISVCASPSGAAAARIQQQGTRSAAVSQLPPAAIAVPGGSCDIHLHARHNPKSSVSPR